jgi:adenylate cyclase
MPPVRRLTAILAADVAGYSRLMGADEEGTHERLQAHLRELVNPKISEHRGRTVKNTGDGLLAEFPSVIDAVRCAVEVQRGMTDREPDVPDERRIRFRIGINLGDVIVEEHDIFGDGVNVAARLEALAEPGGVLVSNTVHDHVRDRLPFAFEDLGEQQVKNIARPVRVYAVRPQGTAEVTAKVASTASSSPPNAAPRLSIVVLPFTNLSDDPEQQYFADGITEDLTTDLSRIAGMFVISRNTAFTYRNKPIDTKQIGRELRVRYVLEGSVRRSGNQLRVNAQLIDAEIDAHLWAERFDGDTADLFALQDEITSRIAIALNVELVSAATAQPTEHPDALDFTLRGRALINTPPSLDSIAAAINLLERALALDPGSVEAQSHLAIILTRRVLDFRGSAHATDLRRAEALAAKSVAASPRSSLAHIAKGHVLRAQGKCADAIPEYETALAFDRNAVKALADIGRCKIYIGLIDEGITAQEHAVRLSPRDPQMWSWAYRIGEGHLLQSRIDDAIPWFERARNANPAPAYIRAYLAAAHALRGDVDRATTELAEARRLRGEGSYSSIAQLRADTRYETDKVRALCEATFYAGLRKVGVPEE